MPLYTVASGDKIDETDHNSLVEAVLENTGAIEVNSHNIYELFLQFYYDGKQVPSQGLFFDGFSDETKADGYSGTLTAGASSGQKVITLDDTTELEDGMGIHIYDTTNQEEKIIDTVDSGTQITVTVNLVNSYLSGDIVKRSSTAINTVGRLLEMADFGTGDLGTHSVDLDYTDTDYLKIDDGDQAGLDLTNSDFTIEFWYKPALIPAFGTAYVTQYLINKMDSSTKNGFGININDGADNGGRLGWIIGNGSSDFSGSFNKIYTTGVWIHFVMTYDESSGVIDIWNAPEGGSHTKIVSSSTGVTGGAGNNTKYFAIGNSQESPNPADGQFDEVRVWNDIRSEAEMNDNFEKELTGSEANLVSYWKLNNSYLDETTNENTLTPVNSPTFLTDVPQVVLPDTGDNKKGIFHSVKNSFQQPMASAKAWVTRNFGSQYNLAYAIVVTDTSLKITGDVTDEFVDGNTIDISTPDNLFRERKTINGTPTFASGETTITFTPAVARSAGYATADFVERVDVKPKISIVADGAEEDLDDMTYVRSEVDFDDAEVEDEYSYTPSSAGEDCVAKIELTREDTAKEPYCKKYGIALIKE